MSQVPEYRNDSETFEGRPLSVIVSAIVADIQNILRDEIRLASSEFKDKARQSKKAAVFLGGAAGMGLFSAACFIATCIAALALVLPVWLSALIMGVLLAAGAGGAFILGRMALDEVDAIPQQTVESMKDNADWIRNRI